MHAVSIESLAGKKLGILITHPPEHPGFRHALGLASAALAAGVQVYAYCLDEAVTGLDDQNLQNLRQSGLALYACAYGARRKGVLMRDQALFAGLATVNDLLIATDRFICF
jgi:hypothetical protein